MQKELIPTVKNQKICIFDKNKVEMDGVSSILTFDEEYVRLETNMGELVIEGEALKIEGLSKETGRIFVVGNIFGLQFANTKTKKRRRG